jgi:ribosomal protein S18 acetylase RimI-like enzyme
MTILIRPATNADRAALFDVALASWLDAHSVLLPPAAVRDAPAMINRAFDRRLDELRVAVSDGRIVGYYSLGRADDPKSVNYLWHLYVDPACQRRGIGRALHTAAMTEIGSRACTLAWLDVVSGNVKAIAFYRTLGWTETGRERVDGIELVTMQSMV